jgi:hypothetical protein
VTERVLLLREKIVTLREEGEIFTSISEAIAITNVKVFDGNALTTERTVVIDNGIISEAGRFVADRVAEGADCMQDILPSDKAKNFSNLALLAMQHYRRAFQNTVLSPLF